MKPSALRWISRMFVRTVYKKELNGPGLLVQLMMLLVCFWAAWGWRSAWPAVAAPQLNGSGPLECVANVAHLLHPCWRWSKLSGGRDGCSCWQRCLLKSGRQSKKWVQVKGQNQSTEADDQQKAQYNQEQNMIKNQNIKHWLAWQVRQEYTERYFTTLPKV